MLPKSCSTRPRQNQVMPGKGLVAFAGLSTLGTMNQAGPQQPGWAQAGRGTMARVGGGQWPWGPGLALHHSVLCILSVCSPRTHDGPRQRVSGPDGKTPWRGWFPVAGP